jgi:signal transduction histidine kinase
VEATLAISMSVFSLVFVVQSLPSLIGQWPRTDPSIGLVLVVLVYGWTGVAALAAVLRIWTRAAFLVVALAYLVALPLWPFALHDALPVGQQPWLFLLAPMPTGFLIIAARTWIVPLVYAAVTCSAVGALELLPQGGAGGDRLKATLDPLYAFFLDIALLTLIVALRQAARSVDAAQRAALDRYAAARISEAMEHERVQIDALVHDRVLTTFLTAARAEDPSETALATSMAEDAIRQLTGGGPVPSAGKRPVDLDEVTRWLRRDGAAVAEAFTWTRTGSESATVPAAVAEAIVSAAVQAMVNSVNHAGGLDVPRSVEVRMGDDALSVAVTDEGRGFAMADIPSERLGVRISIIERVRTVGGTARIRSAPGKGTRVEVGWRATTGERAQQPAPEPEVVAR